MTVDSRYQLLTLDTLSAAELLDRTPFLVVHGTVDTYCTPEGAQAIFDRATGPKEIEWIETPNHIDIYDRPEPRRAGGRSGWRGSWASSWRPRERAGGCLRNSSSSRFSSSAASTPTRWPGAGDLDEAGAGDLGGEVARDRVEVRLVALADHDERRDAQLRERTQLAATAPPARRAPSAARARAAAAGAPRRGTPARPRSRRSRRSARSRSPASIAACSSCQFARHLLAEAPAREARADEHELLDAIRVGERRLQRHRAAERVADEHARAGAPRRGRRTRTASRGIGSVP